MFSVGFVYSRIGMSISPTAKIAIFEFGSRLIAKWWDPNCGRSLSFIPVLYNQQTIERGSQNFSSGERYNASLHKDRAIVGSDFTMLLILIKIPI
ncbi:MAG: hypothetical protein WAJ93_17660 [Candidatus Nitrosopolaris sp.]